uniref:Uncharacterized protein n=1 Tax=Arundo donax TaxID=35708 RepID=A0A0A9D397_ARUDO
MSNWPLPKTKRHKDHPLPGSSPQRRTSHFFSLQGLAPSMRLNWQLQWCVVEFLYLFVSGIACLDRAFPFHQLDHSSSILLFFEKLVRAPSSSNPCCTCFRFFVDTIWQWLILEHLMRLRVATADPVGGNIHTGIA